MEYGGNTSTWSFESGELKRYTWDFMCNFVNLSNFSTSGSMYAINKKKKIQHAYVKINIS